MTVTRGQSDPIPKKGGVRQWLNRFLLFYIGGMIAFVLSFRYLRLSDEMLFGLGAAVVVLFPVIYLVMTSFILPLSRREFKTTAQRTAVTVVLGILAVVFFAVLPVLVPFLGFIFIVWLSSNMRNTRAPDTYDPEREMRQYKQIKDEQNRP